MLPLGSLRPNPGMGEPRESRLSHDEQRTLFTLWEIARSPLMLGANFTMLDPFTRSLVTNSRIIAINQAAYDSHPVTGLLSGFYGAQVWMASSGSRGKPAGYMALFNLKDEPAHLSVTWKHLGIEGWHPALELWSDAKLPAAPLIEVTLPAHGSAV